MESKIYNQKGKEAGTVSLPESVFGAKWNPDLVHQVVTSMLSNRRSGLAHAKGRGEVSGGGKKPWRQKGTGRARHGSIRSPLWRGGGTTFGPIKDKNYFRKVNKSAKRAALFSVLSKKFKDGQILFLDNLSLSEPKTKEAKSTLVNLSKISSFERVGLGANKTMIISPDKNKTLDRGFHNFGNIVLVESRNLNPVDLLNVKFVLMINPEKSMSFLVKNN